MWTIFFIILGFIWLISISYNLGIITKQRTEGINKTFDFILICQITLLAPFLMAAHIGYSLEEFNLRMFNEKNKNE